MNYDAEYPVATQVAESTTWLFNMFPWPNTAQDVQHALEAFHKVFGQLQVAVDAHAAARLA